MRRSPTQLSTMDTCGEQYRLKYIEHVPQREMWAGVGGAAYATCVQLAEVMLNSDPPHPEASEADWDIMASAFADGYRRAFADETAERVLKNPDYPPSQWYVNSKGEGREWWLENGPQMVYKYVMAQRGRDFIVLATEQHMTLDDLGGAPWQGYADRVEYQAAGRKLIITDDKTGRLPMDRHQLDAYALWASGQEWPHPVDEIWTRWRNARTGEYKYARLFDPERDVSTLTTRYHTLNLMDNYQLYPPRPSTSNCKPCPVRSSCPLSAWRD